MSHRVLAVEDEPALPETLEYSLKRQGYQVVTAAEGPATSAAIGYRFEG